MDSKASVRGHPIHPMLVMFPLGLFPVALLFDVVWFLTGDFLWLNFAFWLLVVGVIATVLAMIPGFIDYYATVKPYDAARPTGTKHMVTGIVTLVVFTAAVLVRWLAGAWGFTATAPSFDGTLVTGSIILNLVGNAALGYQGYLGGSLTYEHGIGVNEPHRHERAQARGRSERGGGEP